MLTGDAAISSVIPFSGHQAVTMSCISLRFQNRLSHAHMKDVDKYTKEVPKLLCLAQLNDCVELITAFILELIDMTVNVHQNDYIFPPPCPIHGSYNPPSGTAYYFSPTGEQVRRMPDLQVNSTSTNKNYDDNPLMGNATKSTLVYHMVDMDTCSFGSVPFMGTHMVFISLMEVKEGRILSHCFSNSKKKCQNTYFMTLHVGYQSMHSTEHHPCLPTQDSGMICFILWAMHVEITSNHVMLKDLRV